MRTRLRLQIPWPNVHPPHFHGNHMRLKSYGAGCLILFLVAVFFFVLAWKFSVITAMILLILCGMVGNVLYIDRTMRKPGKGGKQSDHPGDAD